MIKKNLKMMILTSLVILLPIVAGVILWDKLPAEMAVHFSQNGEPDNWASKGFVVFGLPLILVAVHWFAVAFTGVDPKNKNISDKMITLVLWLCPAIAIVGCGSTYMYALDNSYNTFSTASLLLGCMFIIIGNYMPKMKQSYTIGIKLPWTLNSEENWNRTHRLAGYTFILGGVVLIISGFMEQYWLVFVGLVLMSGIPAVYSYLLYKKGI